MKQPGPDAKEQEERRPAGPYDLLKQVSPAPYKPHSPVGAQTSPEKTVEERARERFHRRND